MFFVLKIFRQGSLYGVVDTEHGELVYLAEFVHQLCGCGTVTYLPSGHVKGLSEGCADKTSRGKIIETGDTLVFLAIKNDMFVDFVADQNDMVEEFLSLI